jgi:hypothetical protein
MIARHHLATSLGCGLAVGAVALSAGWPLGLGAVPLAVAAWGAGAGPDIDAPPHHGAHGSVPGSIAAEAHGPASRALAHLVNRTHHGHRGWTHRLWYSALLGALVALCGSLWPAWTTLATVAYFGTFPLFTALPGHRTRRLRRLGPLGLLGTEHFAWAWALAGGAAAAYWAPVGAWMGAAVGIGWYSHVLADRAQSGLWKLGGRVELAVASAVLVTGALSMVLALDLGSVAAQLLRQGV